MLRTRDLRWITRGLRFRLAAIYAAFFAILLIAVALLFRAQAVTALNDQAHAVLDQEWAAMKGYLRIEPNPETKKNEAYWYYDNLDSDESRIVLNIKRIYVIADSRGAAITENSTDAPAISPTYAEIGREPAAEIQERVRRAAAASRPNSEPLTFWDVRRNRQGDEFLIRSGVAYDQGHLMNGQELPYYVSIGTPLRQYNNILRQFTTWVFFLIIPGAILLGSGLGWVVAGRALSPLVQVAQAAQRISGSNLSTRIPTRSAGDELDYLILAFNRMIERLDANFRQIKQFSTDVSHELRTPITAIRGQLEVALFTAQTTDQYREAMFNALQDIDRLSQIVRALLLLSQAESGQLALQKSTLDLSDVAEDLVDQFQIPAEAAGVRLMVDAAKGCEVDADRVQIERMITNLLSNAMKFTPEGGEVKVSVRHVREAEDKPPKCVQLVVEDNGCGIPTEHLSHIFDRFYRVPGATHEQGLGLGLSFVDWIVKAHRGEISVESSPGKGARFAIQLPVANGASSSVEMPRPNAIMNKL
jgi:heavy metal sensor kinase